MNDRPEAHVPMLVRTGCAKQGRRRATPTSLVPKTSDMRHMLRSQPVRRNSQANAPPGTPSVVGPEQRPESGCAAHRSHSCEDCPARRFQSTVVGQLDCAIDPTKAHTVDRSRVLQGKSTSRARLRELDPSREVRPRRSRNSPDCARPHPAPTRWQLREQGPPLLHGFDSPGCRRLQPWHAEPCLKPYWHAERCNREAPRGWKLSRESVGRGEWTSHTIKHMTAREAEMTDEATPSPRCTTTIGRRVVSLHNDPPQPTEPTSSWPIRRRGGDPASRTPTPRSPPEGGRPQTTPARTRRPKIIDIRAQTFATNAPSPRLLESHRHCGEASGDRPMGLDPNPKTPARLPPSPPQTTQQAAAHRMPSLWPPTAVETWSPRCDGVLHALAHPRLSRH